MAVLPPLTHALSIFFPTQSNYHQWDVDLYQNRHDFVWKYGSPLVELLDPQPNERILDVGCGSGELTRTIASHMAEKAHKDVKIEPHNPHNQGLVLGMDHDANMIQRAQIQQNESGPNYLHPKYFPPVHFFQGNACDFSLPNQEDTLVDAIFSNAALHWVPDASTAVTAMSQVLKPGGRFVVEFGGKGNIDSIVQAANQVMGRTKDHNPWYFPSVGEYASLLDQHGDIDVTYAWLFDRPTILEGDDGMKKWLQMFGGALLDEGDAGNDPIDLDSIMDEVVEILKATLHDDTNSMWTADYRRLRIVGQKKM